LDLALKIKLISFSCLIFKVLIAVGSPSKGKAHVCRLIYVPCVTSSDREYEFDTIPNYKQIFYDVWRLLLRQNP